VIGGKRGQEGAAWSQSEHRLECYRSYDWWSFIFCLVVYGVVGGLLVGGGRRRKGAKEFSHRLSSVVRAFASGRKTAGSIPSPGKFMRGVSWTPNPTSAVLLFYAP